MIYWIKTRDATEMKALLTLLSLRGCNTVDGKTIAQFLVSHRRGVLALHRTVIAYDSATITTCSSYRQGLAFLLSGMNLKTLIGFKRALAIADKPFVRSRPLYYLGFEIEGCVADDARQDLVNYICALYPGIPANRLIHADGSIRPKCRGIEIVTPPLPAHTAVAKLEWLLGTLNVMTEEGMFETNGSCGLHVNVSEAKSFDWPNPSARRQFTYEFMKRLDVPKWRKAFRRQRNKYCWWRGAPESVSDIHRDKAVTEQAMHLMATEGWGATTAVQKAKHWAAINTSHVDADSARRLEVRIAGGKGYHADLDKLRDFLLDIREAAAQAYGTI